MYRTALVLLGVLTAAVLVLGQPAIELTLIVDQDSLTVYVPGSAPIALGDFAFAPNEDDRYPLQAYGAFRGLDFDAIPAPICLRLVRASSSAPLPLGCPGESTLIHRVPNADVFWWDAAQNNARALYIYMGDVSAAFCLNTVPRCRFAYPPQLPAVRPVTAAPTAAPLRNGAVHLIERPNVPMLRQDPRGTQILSAMILPPNQAVRITGERLSDGFREYYPVALANAPTITGWIETRDIGRFLPPTPIPAAPSIPRDMPLPSPMPAQVCGDGSCLGNETSLTCPTDCQTPMPPVQSFPCGDGTCSAGETLTCPSDCPTAQPTSPCGDGICSGNETSLTCPVDCPTPMPG